MLLMSINSISVSHTSWMIPREVDPVGANPYKKLSYLSFDPSIADDAAARLSSVREMKETSKIPLQPSPLPPPFRSICLHPNQRPSPAPLPPSFLFAHVVFAPPTSSTSMLVKTAKMEL